MGAVAMQLDKLAKARNCRNSSGIGELLHVSRSTISQWRSGTTYPEEDRIAQMAKLAHEDPAVWLAQVRAERATGDAAKAWRDAVRRLSIAAAIAVAILPGLPRCDTRSGLAIAETERAAVVGIMRRGLRSMYRWLAQLWTAGDAYGSAPLLAA